MFSKYAYHAPKSKDEFIESVALELRHSGERPNQWPRTVKDLLADLLDLAKAVNFKLENAGHQKRLAEVYALYLLAGLCGLLLWHGSGIAKSDVTWLEENRFTLRAWGLGLAVVFLGVNIERSNFFATVWRHSIAKFAASIALSALVVYSTASASSLINGVFSVDAAALPFTRALLAGWIAFVHIARPLTLVVGLFALAQGLALVAYCKDKFAPDERTRTPDFPWHSLGVLVLSIAVMSSLHTWLNKSLSVEQLPMKIFQMARVLDFNARHNCSNLDSRAAVIFIGPDQGKVLVDSSWSALPDLEQFISQPATESDAPPKRFQVVPCLP
jgi:hypothetical protein